MSTEIANVVQSGKMSKTSAKNIVIHVHVDGTAWVAGYS